MKMKGPKGAHPTVRGWVHSRTGELLKSQKITQVQIDEWHGITPHPKTDAVEEAIQDAFTEGKIQAAMSDHYAAMTKNELEEHGREHGIELDKRLKKDTMIANLVAHLSEH